MSPKIYGSAEAVALSYVEHAGHRSLALATGCFDALTPGHVRMLQQASQIENLEFAFFYPLIVGINSDASVRRLKGQGRPIYSEEDRALVLAQLDCVHAVFSFGEDTVTEALKTLRPAVWVKGGDRTLETLHPEERKTAEEIGTRIVILPRIGVYSTTELVRRMKG